MRARAVAYVRVSTREQAKSGLGIEAQRESNAAAAKALGLRIVRTFADKGLSGDLAPARRPGLMDARAELKRGDVLLVAKRDRLSRDRIEISIFERDLSRRGVRVLSAAGEGTHSDDTDARLQRAIVDTFAEHERLVIADRTRRALRACRAEGRCAGATPFGWCKRPDKRLVQVAAEQRALKAIFGLRDKGRLGFRAIARTLTERGFAPRGKAWYPATVREILKTRARLSSRSAP